jgi:ankyrin repeat protein
MTPLMWACFSGRNDVALLLMDKGVDIEATNNVGTMFANSYIYIVLILMSDVCCRKDILH